MLVVNFFAGAGAGKSTTAAYVFSRLKLAGEKAELVAEYAKDLTWDESLQKLAYQPLVFAQQAWRLARLAEKANVAVTDSPLLLSLIYTPAYFPKSFSDYVKWEASRYTSINFLLQRVKPYQKFGRTQNEQEAMKKDADTLTLLTENSIPYTAITGDEKGAALAYAHVSSYLKG